MISRLFLRVFGGLTNQTLTFSPGVNIVLGPNEVGKSTVFRALGHTILTPTKLDKRTFDRDLSPLMPRPAGNTVETEMTISADGEFFLRKEWGADPSEEIKTPDGAIVRGSHEVAELIDRLVPVGLGSFRTLFLADQSQLDQSFASLRASQARDDAATILRQAAFDTGTVSVDLFNRRLSERIEELLGRWDAAAQRPEGGRNYLNPWKQRAGLVLNAHYELQRSEAELRSAQSSEGELESAGSDLELAAETIRGVQTFLDTNTDAYRQLREARGVEGQIEAAQERLRRLRESNRRWPVVENDLASTTAKLSGLRQQAQELAERTANEAVASGAKEIVARHDQFLELMKQKDAQKAAIQQMPAPTGDDLANLREVDGDVVAAEARLTAGTLRISVASETKRDVIVRIDGGQDTSLEVGPASPAEISANRRVEVTAEDLSMHAEAGEESFGELTSQLTELQTERAALLKRLRVKDTAAAEQALTDLRDVTAALARLDDQIGAQLGALSEAEFAEEAEQAHRLLADHITLAPAGSAADLDQGDTSARLADLREQIGAADARTEQLAGDLRHMEEEYQSQDKLEDQLGAVKLSLSELETRLTDVEIPEGFEGIDQFLAGYESKKSELDQGAQAYTAARVTYAETLGRQPEQSSEELATIHEEAKSAFERVQRSSRALLRLRERAETIVSELDDGTFGPYEARVGHYLSIMTDRQYITAEAGGDPLLPSSFERSDGPALPYALLSQGTQDTIALAIRLSLAETLLSGAVAPLLLDDPLVDLDRVRREGAARAIEEFAADRQVILFTCHPEHAALFGEAHVVEME